MTKQVTIIERGRGPQLSTSRITVQDLVPYFQENFSYDQIRVVMPILTIEDIQAVARYVREHYDAVMEQDRRIRDRAAQRKNAPEVEEILRKGGQKMAQLRESFRKKNASAERNGDPSSR
ncbi:MAG: hypothetical protein HY040_25430 [Planctomycetes bacterium]|nr:hypothetical protein [Planctomycetota bacterium]